MVKNIFETMNAIDVRAGQVIHLGGQVACCDERSDFCEMIVDNFDCVGDLLSLDEDLDQDYEIIEQLVESELYGFLVRMETPVPQNTKNGSYNSGWGMYTTKWFYSNDLEQIYKDAITWRNKYIADKLSEA